MNLVFSNKARSLGFTLVEMAIVLIIFGLMLGSMLVPISAQIDLHNYEENRKKMEEIKEALLGYGVSHGYLPCPAKSYLDGSEDRIGNVCNKRVGFLPWSELGVQKLDSWGHLYSYSVTPAFTSSSTKIGFTTNPDITIKTRDSSGALVLLSNTNALPLVVYSYGKNGFWATNDDGSSISDSSSTNIDEDTNGNAAGSNYGTQLVSRELSSNDATAGGEFDDLVVWVSRNVYINRMVAAGQLP